MRVDLRYLGKSGVREAGGASTLAFAPNLARPKVFFDAEIKNPVRFREAMGALHDVVVGDLRFEKKDKAAYEAYKAEEARKENEIRQAMHDRTKQDELQKIAKEPIPPNLETDFRRLHGVYWTARRAWAAELSRNDPELFRHLVPCDPVVTVAPDVVFFECFAKDESSYGCFTVARDAFRGESAAGLGTTNVDYSLALYEHFQTLRTYRSTRLLVDPTGFEVNVAGREGYREEKIDLPPSWLRGFGQLQAAMAMPSRDVELSVDAVYSLLAWLKRHREKTGPRSVLFKLVPGKPVTLVLEPWGVEVVSRGKAYGGERAEEIKVWGRRRLMALARLLPLAERFDVRLYGSGMPSIWTAHMGEMRFVLALSGWTANDWTRGSNLELHFAETKDDPRTTEAIARVLGEARALSLAAISAAVGAGEAEILGGLHALAKRGQIVFDFARDVYRWRPILSVPLAESIVGGVSPELVEGRRLAASGAVDVAREEDIGQGRRLYAARVAEVECEAILDADLLVSRAKCKCPHFFKGGLRAGPCRHLIALRLRVLELMENARPAARSASAAPARPVAVALQPLALPEIVAEALEAQATKRGLGLHDIIAQAWRIARESIRRAATDAELPPRAPGRKRALTVALDAAIVAELQAEAARLDVSVAAVIERAWHFAEPAMKLTTSLLP